MLLLSSRKEAMPARSNQLTCLLSYDGIGWKRGADVCCVVGLGQVELVRSEKYSRRMNRCPKSRRMRTGTCVRGTLPC